jgi:hypothetical protein
MRALDQKCGETWSLSRLCFGASDVTPALQPFTLPQCLHPMCCQIRPPTHPFYSIRPDHAPVGAKKQPPRDSGRFYDASAMASTANDRKAKEWTVWCKILLRCQGRHWFIAFANNGTTAHPGLRWLQPHSTGGIGLRRSTGPAMPSIPRRLLRAPCAYAPSR